MAQNVVQDQNNLFPEDIILYIAPWASSYTSLSDITSTTYNVVWSNVGALAEYSRESANASVQPAAFNVEHKQVITKEAETINCTLEEFNSTIVNLMRGGVSVIVSTSLPNSTSAASATVIYSGGSDTLNPFMLWEYASYSDGRSKQTFYPYVHYVSGGSLNPKAQNTGEYATMPFVLEARESPNFVYNNKQVYRVEVFSTSST